MPPPLGGALGSLVSAELRSEVHAHLRLLDGGAQPDEEQRAALAVVKRAAYETSLRSCSTGCELDRRARAFSPLSTGSAVFDSLLCGGLRRGEVVELSGAPASGKTQARCPTARTREHPDTYGSCACARPPALPERG